MKQQQMTQEVMTAEIVKREVEFIEAEKKAIRDSILFYGSEEDIFGVM